MTPTPHSPRLLKAGLILLDPDSGATDRVIVLQYNPDSLSRTLQVQAVEGQGGDRSLPLRLRGPPVETFRVEAEIDATDQLAAGGSPEVDLGIHPHLAALETLIYPSSGRMIENDRLAGMGTLEITPAEAPLTLFVWGRERVLPVRVTELSVTEEAFDPRLNPIRAKVTLGLRVLNVNDVGFDHKGGALYMAYHQSKERLAKKGLRGTIEQLGLEGSP